MQHKIESRQVIRKTKPTFFLTPPLPKLFLKGGGGGLGQDGHVIFFQIETRNSKQSGMTDFTNPKHIHTVHVNIPQVTVSWMPAHSIIPVSNPTRTLVPSSQTASLNPASSCTPAVHFSTSGATSGLAQYHSDPSQYLPVNPEAPSRIPPSTTTKSFYSLILNLVLELVHCL